MIPVCACLYMFIRRGALYECGRGPYLIIIRVWARPVSHCYSSVGGAYFSLGGEHYSSVGQAHMSLLFECGRDSYLIGQGPLYDVYGIWYFGELTKLCAYDFTLCFRYFRFQGEELG